jgi:probable F420-dependent oxidoreductase
MIQGHVSGGDHPSLGHIGAWSFDFVLAPLGTTRAALERIEEAGYGAAWYPEVAWGRESLSQAALLLAWSDRIVVASGIASIFARDAVAMENGARGLSEAYPGRFLLGIGVSHAPLVAARGGEYRRPLTTMGSYLDAMDGSAYSPGRSAPRMLAALAPKMLELAGSRAAGAHTYFVPPEHTTIARQALGAKPLLAVEQAVVLETDRARAHELARQHMGPYLQLPNYRNNLLRLGFAEDELADGGTDRVVDAIVAWGDVAAIQERVRAHLAAGADHVAVQPIHGQSGAFPVDTFVELAPALLELEA